MKKIEAFNEVQLIITSCLCVFGVFLFVVGVFLFVVGVFLFVVGVFLFVAGVLLGFCFYFLINSEKLF